MPLPPALAAKLAKRGIIKKAEAAKERKAAEPNTETEAKSDAQPVAAEEIIAESYDDSAQHATEPPNMLGVPPPGIPKTIPPYLGYSLCPNKWNVYHDCTSGCRDLWNVIKQVDSKYDAKRVRMMAKYPLPSNWREILDQGMGRYYYWNTDNNMVSWLPPGHPKCTVSRSAAELRRLMHTERAQRLAAEAAGENTKNSDSNHSDSDSNSSDSDSEGNKKRKSTKRRRSHSVDGSDDSNSDSDEDIPPSPPSKWPNRPSSPQRSRRGRSDRGARSGRGRPSRDALDPMDPASYGECPRGSWSSGLNDRAEAKTGVDTTAGGILYQQRPYPNPGAVLRANAANSAGPQKPDSA